MRLTFVSVLTTTLFLFLTGCHEREVNTPVAHKLQTLHFQGGTKAADLDLGEIRFGQEGDTERLVLDSYRHTLSSGAKAKASGIYQISYIPYEHRMVGKITGYHHFSALLSKGFKKFAESNYIEKIKLLAHSAPDTYTFEILFKKEVTPTIFDLQNPARIVIDLKEAPKTVPTAASGTPGKSEAARTPSKKIRESDEEILHLIEQVKTMQYHNQKSQNPFDYSQYFSGGTSTGQKLPLQQVKITKTPESHVLLKIFCPTIPPYVIHYDDKYKRIIIVLDECHDTAHTVNIAPLPKSIVKQSKVIETTEGTAIILWLTQDARINVLELYKPTNITIDIAPMYRLYIGT